MTPAILNMQDILKSEFNSKVLNFNVGFHHLLNTFGHLQKSLFVYLTPSFKSTPGKLENMPDYGRNQICDLWINAMLCQLPQVAEHIG